MMRYVRWCVNCHRKLDASVTRGSLRKWPRKDAEQGQYDLYNSSMPCIATRYQLPPDV
jgi:hypothetical protein